jgi:undecaprenyl-diphosphatase
VRDGVKPYFSSSTDNGFPSDHTALSTVVAAIVFTYKKAVGIILLLIALIIGAARVIAGVHHGQDIIGAFIISIIAVFLAKLLTNFITNKFKQSL